MFEIRDNPVDGMKTCAGESLSAARSLFTPCTVGGSLLEAITEAARNAASGGVALLSPACSSFDQFRNHQEYGEIFCQAVKSIGGGAHGSHPNKSDRTETT
jgi:UDP-N-acetylmuramoylalanine--D-glutamate ligase